MPRARIILLLLPLLATLAAFKPATVEMKDLAFKPASLTVAPGTTVTWLNKDSRDYNVTADNGSFTSGTIPPGGSFSHTFNTAGSFPYGSRLHPRMRGVVVVK